MALKVVMSHQALQYLSIVMLLMSRKRSLARKA